VSQGVVGRQRGRRLVHHGGAGVRAEDAPVVEHALRHVSSSSHPFLLHLHLLATTTTSTTRVVHFHDAADVWWSPPLAYNFLFYKKLKNFALWKTIKRIF
jgi:hypothetical protein